MGIYRNIILNYPYFGILSRYFREDFPAYAPKIDASPGQKFARL